MQDFKKMFTSTTSVKCHDAFTKKPLTESHLHNLNYCIKTNRNNNRKQPSHLLSGSFQLSDQILSLMSRKVSSADLLVSKPLFGDGHS